MPKYYLTFGAKYEKETHPYLPGINPDSYIEIDAISELDARVKVFNIFGDKWAFIFNEKTFIKSMFPKGKFATLEEIKSLKYDTFYYIKHKNEEFNPITIISETEKDHTLIPEQLMIMNNIVNLATTMATFPRVDKFKNYIIEFHENIINGFSKNDTISFKDKNYCETLSTKIGELVELIRNYKHYNK